MAQLMQAFDARNVDPTQGVGGLPIGKHPVIAIKSEVKPTKDNDSGYLQFDLQVIDGPNKGAIGAYRLNLYHTSQQTVEIAHKQLSALCHVTGVFQVQNSEQLHNIPFIVEVGLQKEPNPNKYTDVKRVFDINGNEPGQAGKGGGQQQNQQQQGNNGGGNWGGNNGGNQNQNQQQNNGGNNAGWGGNSQVANNVPMPDNNGGNNNGQNNGNNGGYDQNQNQNQNQNQQGNGGGWQGNGGNQQQGNNNQQQQQNNNGNQGGNGGGWAQNGGGNNNGGGNSNAPAWGQPRN